MGLLKKTQQQYYSGARKTFTGDGVLRSFTIANNQSAISASAVNANGIPYLKPSEVKIYFDGVLQYQYDSAGTSLYSVAWSVNWGWHAWFLIAPSNGVVIDIDVDTGFGDYQFLNIDNIISQFLVSYVGEGKIIPKVKRTDVIFHAKRALQELSYDTLKSCKAQEIQLPPSLKMILPQDYVNYIKLTWSDSSGIEHVLYPTSKTSNPFNIKQDVNGDYSFDIDDDITVPIGNRDDTSDLIPTNSDESDTWSSYKSNTPSENNDDYEDDTRWPHGGGRYGLDPQYAQSNGSFYIDCAKGLIHFSSNLSGKTIILHYLSDSLGTDDEMVIHKFAEEAIYKWIAYAIVSTRANIQEYIVNRFRKEKFAATRKAKLRLSNIKLEELTRILRGRSKQIKH